MTSDDTLSALKASTVHKLSVGPDNSEFFPQLWFLLMTLMVFGSYVAWDLKLFSQIVALDNSYMASVIMALVVVMTAHCGWHICHTFHYTRSAHRWLTESHLHANCESEFMLRVISDLSVQQHDVQQHGNGDDSDAIIEIHADTVRAPAELGWFFVDLAVRLGLLGTIIGFILIFATLDNISIDGGDDLKNLLVAMSGGMGTALYTTLTGLVGASLLSFQYLVLGRQTENLVGLMLRIRRRIRSPAITFTL